MTFLQLGALNSGSKGARTARMGLGQDIRNLLVVETRAFVSFYLTTKVLDLLSSQNCTKSSMNAVSKGSNRSKNSASVRSPLMA
jgi:hypothetical protein